MGKRTQIRVIGLSEKKKSSEFLVMLLGEGPGKRCFTVVIGKSEANAISHKLQHIEPKRPTIYNAYLDTLEKMGGKVRSVEIYAMKNDIFYTRVVWIIEEERVFWEPLATETRISDGVAIALFADKPIFIDDDLLSELSEGVEVREVGNTIGTVTKVPLSELTDKELQKMLQESIEKEAYEASAKFRNEIERRKHLSEGEKHGEEK